MSAVSETLFRKRCLITVADLVKDTARRAADAAEEANDVLLAVFGAHFKPVKNALGRLDWDGFVANLGLIEVTWHESGSPSVTTITATILVAEEQVLDFVDVAGLSLVIAPSPPDDGSEITFEIDVGANVLAARLRAPLALRIDRSLLRPAKKDGGRWVEDSSAPAVQVGSTGEAMLGIGPDGLTLAGMPRLSLLGFIGETDFVLEVTDAGLVLGDGDALPTSRPAEITPGWHGMFFTTAALHLPPDFAVPLTDAVVKDGYFGSGGVSGEVDLTGRTASGTLFGFEFHLTELHLAFRQNAITRSEARGTLVVPFFDADLAVRVGFDARGRPTVRLDTGGGTATLERAGVVKVTLERLGLEVDGARGRLRIGGTIEPQLLGAAGTGVDALEVRELTVDSDGNISFDGGGFDLPALPRFDFHGFLAEIRRIGFGTIGAGAADLRRFASYSGRLKLVDGLSLAAEFDNLRLTWDPKRDPTLPEALPEIALDGLRIDYTLPDVLSFDGLLRYVDGPDPSDAARTLHGFAGGIKLRLPSLQFEIDAQLSVRRVDGQRLRDDGVLVDDTFTAFFVYLDGSFPAGLQIGATGAAVYNLAGLIGYNVEPDRRADEGWYANWYKGERLGGGGTSRGVSSADKWQNRRDAFAIGAGATLGTAADGGHKLNGRLLLVLVLPGPVVLLEGRANLLTDRAKLNDPAAEPAFEAFAVLDHRAGYAQIDVAAHLAKPAGGATPGGLVDVRGGAEAYFDYRRGDAWHLYLGKAEPRDARIRASVLGLFVGEFYLMVDPRQLRTGFWVGYDKRWKKGPLKASIQAFIAGDATISWKPEHFVGRVELQGSIALSAFGVGVTLSIAATVEGEAASPSRFEAAIKAKLDLPWPLPDKRVNASIRRLTPGTPPLPVLVDSAVVEHGLATERWPLARLPRYDRAPGAQGDPPPDGLAGYWDGAPQPFSDDDGTQADLLGRAYDEDADLVGVPEVPVDALPAIAFAKPLYDDIGLGHARPGVPERIAGVVREHHLVRLTLDRIVPGDDPSATASWKRVADLKAGDDPSKSVLGGTWQLATDNADRLVNRQFVLGATTTSHGVREQIGPVFWTWLDGRLGPFECPPTTPDVERCVTWDDIPPGTFCGEAFVLDDVTFVPSAPTAVVLRPVPGLGRHALDPVASFDVTGFPPGTTRVVVCLDVPPGSRAVATAFAGGETVDSASATGTGVESTAARLELVAPQIDRIAVETGGAWLYCVCYTAPLSPERHAAGARWRSTVEVTRSAWRRTAPLFEPGFVHRLTVATAIVQRGAATKPLTERIYFRTGLPPGVDALPLDAADLAGPATPDGSDAAAHPQHYPERGTLRDALPYVAETAPAPDARFAYTGYDLAVAFRAPHVEAMYRLAGWPLRLIAVDDRGATVADLEPAWTGDDLRITRAELEWLVQHDRTTTAGCLPGTALSAIPSDAARDATLRAANTAAPRLKPAAVHEAQLVAIPASAAGGLQPRVVHRWRFTTSRFAHFRHHVGAFDDAVVAETVAAPDAARLADLVRREIERRPAGADPPRFEAVAALLGLGGPPAPPEPGRWRRPPPPVPMLTALRAAGRVVAVLLESPEPFDAARATLGLAASDGTFTIRRAASAGTTLPSGAAKIVAGRPAPAGGGPNDESIDVLLLSPLDIGGWRIERLAVDAPGGAAWSTLFTFPGGSAAAGAPPLPAGTLVRVHGGRRADDPSPDPTVRHHYADRPAAALSAAGDTVRLVDAAGRIAHARPILPDRRYAPRPIAAVWNHDRTAAFLFALASGRVAAWSPGHYRLASTFRRVVDERPELARLRQAGDGADETAELAFTLGGAQLYLPAAARSTGR